MYGVTCKYVPSSGSMRDTVDLLKFPYFISDMSPFFSYSRSVITSYGRIVGFSNEETRSIEIVINVADKNCSEIEFLKAKDKLFSTFEADISARMPGTLYVNGYALRCYFVAEDVGSRLDEASQSTFTVICDQKELWRKDLFTVHFSTDTIPTIVDDPNQGAGGNSGGEEVEIGEPTEISIDKETPYGYNYGYPLPGSTLVIENPLSTPASLKLSIFGPWNNQTMIWIGNNRYWLKNNIASGNYVTIDGTNRSVTMYNIESDSVQSTSNWFRYLDKSHNPFGSIPPGENLISFTEDEPYDFYLTLVDERVCPAWI